VDTDLAGIEEAPQICGIRVSYLYFFRVPGHQISCPGSERSVSNWTVDSLRQSQKKLFNCFFFFFFFFSILSIENGLPERSKKVDDGDFAAIEWWCPFMSVLAIQDEIERMDSISLPRNALLTRKSNATTTHFEWKERGEGG
jgi:hypothetical protein